MKHERDESPRAGLHANGQAVPLLGVEVEAEVIGGHSRARIRQRYRNDERRPVEAVYTFPLPSRGAAIGFTVTVNGRRLEGEVHEREEAFQRYDEALTAGHGAALLEQERPNVFTANVGNLLPGEETVIEVELLEPLHADEGAIRWSLPTLVAPRYVPGSPSGDRTAHGAAEPTDRVPDADRISPPIGDARYGLSLELVFDVGVEVEVESPSHPIRATTTGGKTRVTFAQREVALDRDIVVTAFPRHAASGPLPLASVVAHRAGAGQGVFALSLVPDLAGGLARRDGRTDVVFVIDRSGSMGGSSMDEAKTALRLCLRQLREGDRFAVLAFDDQIEEMRPAMTPLSRSTLEAADRWIDAIDARGGTEMQEPLLRAIDLAKDGVIVLLTDGQVANEDEILKAVLARRGAARVYSFGIGTNVSDALLVGLADKTGGAVESIHPGERVDDKVVAQFARATAPRVTDVEIRFRGVDVGEIAPASTLALVDAEPFTLFGTYESGGRGVAEIRGTCDGEKLYLEVPFDLPEREDRPTVTKLWAQARIRDLERAEVSGRRADAMKDRIVRLAKEHGVSSRYTSFIVVEKRTGDRRVSEQAETRVIPVAAPADWAMFQRIGRSRSRAITASGGIAAPMRMMRMPAPAAMPGGAPLGGFGGASRGAPPPPPAPAMSPPPPRAFASSLSRAKGEATDSGSLEELSLPVAEEAADLEGSGLPAEAAGALESADPVLAILAKQSASGLWEDGGDPILATVKALLGLLRLGLSTSHPVHGAQTKKGVDALLDALAGDTRGADAALVEVALGVAWLLSTGRRTRAQIRELATRGAASAALAALLGRDDEVRAHVERLAQPLC